MKQSEEKKNGLDMTNPVKFDKSIRIEENLLLVKEMLELGSWKEIEQIRLYENAEMEQDEVAGAFVVKFAGRSEN